jgi:small subunit ribosomal protein S11
MFSPHRMLFQRVCRGFAVAPQKPSIRMFSYTPRVCEEDPKQRTTALLSKTLETITEQSTSGARWSQWTPGSNLLQLDPMAGTPGNTMHILHVHASPNNTILTLTDHEGRVLINTSCGTAGFRKAQRSGPEAAYQATQQLVNKATERGIHVQSLHLKLNGFGQGREAVFRALRVVSDWNITRISDATPIPFNGCRPRKARRL